jgi:hypothetical protein
MSLISVGIVNRSRLTDADVSAGAAVLRRQLREHFSPVWHVDAEVEIGAAPGRWIVLLHDHVSELAGYHEQTSEGLPLAVIAVAPESAAQDWVHASSHELMEMLVDPDINLVALERPDAEGRLFAREICDPTAAYEDGYELEGRWVANFVLPAWFRPEGDGEPRQVDHRGLLRHPFEVRPGGYTAVFHAARGTWDALGSDGRESDAAQVDRRLRLRGTDRRHWRTSDMGWTD